MEETTQSNHGAVKEHGRAGASTDSEEVEPTTIGEAAQMLPGCIADKILSEFPRKKQKHSTSGGDLVTSSTDSRAILPSKSNQNDSLEPNVATQGPSAIVGERKPPDSGMGSHGKLAGRTMFTMLIPQWHEIGDGGATVEFDRKKMVSMFEEKAQVRVQQIAGVEVVIVSAKEKEDLHSLTSPAVDSLVNILEYLMPPRAFSDDGYFQTRLLVRNDQAFHLIRSSIFQTIQEEHQGELLVYLSDYSLGLSIDYSIIEFNGWKLDSVSEAVKKIAFKVREIPVSEGELGACLFELSPEGSSEREYDFSKGIHISRVNAEIIGENGAKIEKLQAKRSLTFSITPTKFKPDYVIISIDGALADVKDAENILEGPNPIKVSHVFKKIMALDVSLDDFYDGNPLDGRKWW